MQSYAQIQLCSYSILSTSHKREVNLGFRSKTINMSTLCNLTISFTYNFANLLTESIISIEKKNTNLVNRSIMTQIASLPLLPLCNTNKKSLVIFFHFHSGISSGCNGIIGFLCSFFTYWHTPYLATYSATSLFIFDHQ